MLYYLGKGTEFKKEDCKEYKTQDGAVKAMAKTEDGVVWDENGQVIAAVVDEEDVPEGALNTNPDGSVPAFNDDGTPAGTVDAETVAAVTGENEQETTQDDAEGQQDGSNDDEGRNTPSEEETGENEAKTASEGEIITPQGTMRVTVICDGSLNLRRSASWGNDNICGRATRGQTYNVKEIHVVDGKKMVRTIDDLYLSGESEHVQFEQL